MWMEQLERESAARWKLWEGALLIIFSVGLCKAIAEHDRMRPCDYCKRCYVLWDRPKGLFLAAVREAKCSKVHLVTAFSIQSKNALAPIVSRSVSGTCSSPNKAHLYGALVSLYTLQNCSSQLRFEWHLSVHKLFQNMWGARNRSRQRQKLLSA